jgi:hypothetical protein
LAKKTKYLLIIGVHRSGTSALFNYLKLNDTIVPAKVKELHYFTPLRFGLKLDKKIKYASLFFKTKENTKYLLEASPSYFYGGESICKSVIETTKNEAKCILILRNPTDRFISFYNHCNYLGLIENESLKDFIDKAIVGSKLPLEDNIYRRAIKEGYYIDHISTWQESFSKNF